MITFVNDVTYTSRIIATECCNCHMVFGISAEFQKARLADRRSFYCPNGHGQSFIGKTEEEKLRERLTRAESSNTHLRDQLDSTERSRRALKGQVTKIKRRVGRGVCPCCNRTFADLARHMEGQHPEFVEPTP